MDSKIITSYKDIHGWFDYEDLYSKIICDDLKNGDISVEVGVWLGKSAAFFMSKCQEKNKLVEFYCVDLWAGKQDDPNMDAIIDSHNGSILKQFESNMKDCGHENKYKKIIGDSAQTAQKFSDQSISFCFIDANHHYEYVKKDIMAWIPKMKANSIMAGHDIDRESVQKAVQECFGNKWQKISERCWIVKIT